MDRWPHPQEPLISHVVQRHRPRPSLQNSSLQVPGKAPGAAPDHILPPPDPLGPPLRLVPFPPDLLQLLQALPPSPGWMGLHPLRLYPLVGVLAFWWGVLARLIRSSPGSVLTGRGAGRVPSDTADLPGSPLGQLAPVSRGVRDMSRLSWALSAAAGWEVEVGCEVARGTPGLHALLAHSLHPQAARGAPLQGTEK